MLRYFKRLIRRRKRKWENPDYTLGDIKIDRNEKVDMGNVVNSIFHSEALYDKLKVRCHPDRFVHDEELMNRAGDLFQEITENRRNLKKLEELKIIAEEELKVEV